MLLHLQEIDLVLFRCLNVNQYYNLITERTQFFHNFLPINKSFLSSIAEHFLFLNDLVVIPEFLPAPFCKNNSYLHNSVHDTAHFSALNSIDYLGRFLPMQRFPWRYCSTGIIYEAILNIDIDIFNNEWKLMAQISRIRLNPFFFFFFCWITLTIHLERRKIFSSRGTHRHCANPVKTLALKVWEILFVALDYDVNLKFSTRITFIANQHACPCDS